MKSNEINPKKLIDQAYQELCPPISHTNISAPLRGREEDWRSCEGGRKGGMAVMWCGEDSQKQREVSFGFLLQVGLQWEGKQQMVWFLLHLVSSSVVADGEMALL